MLAAKLAVIAPQVGAISETFIKRHMTDLVPDQTVILTGNTRRPNGGHWTVEGPVLNFYDAQRKLFRREINYGAHKLGLEVFSRPQLAKHFLKKHRVEVILSEYLDLSLEWLKVTRQLNIPFYAHAHGYDISMNLRDAEIRNSYLQLNDASGIITINQVSKQRLIDIGLESSKIHIIPYGVDVPATPIVRPDRDIIKCLSVGRIIPKKGPILLLDAFRRAVEQVPALRLEYVGEGELFSAVRQFVQAFNLEGKVTFYGARSNEFVKELMAKCDIFVQHSLTDELTGDEEGLPVAILEAMAHSLPVVSTFHAGIPEAVINQESGSLVREGDSTAMAAQIVKLAEDYELRQRYGLAAWERTSQFFSWQIEKKNLLNLMKL